jgi:uncharacterized protein (TIGR03066 family)
MKLPICVATLIVPALVLSLGCKKPTPVGKWTGSFNNIPLTFDFKEDGKLALSGSAMGQNIAINGTWSVEGDQLTTNLTSGTPAMVMSFIPADKRKSTGAWKLEGETLSLTQGSQSQALTRVKE